MSSIFFIFINSKYFPISLMTFSFGSWVIKHVLFNLQIFKDFPNVSVTNVYFLSAMTQKHVFLLPFGTEHSTYVS